MNIEVNNAGGETESGWRTVLDGPISFDLVEFTGVEGVLGDVVLPPGRYNQLRLEVVEALITIQGEEVNATVPSGTLRFTGGFDLVAGETTVITMDFDAAKSVVIRGRMDPLLKPVVKLLVRKGGEELADARQIDEIEETPEPSPTETPGRQ